MKDRLDINDKLLIITDSEVMLASEGKLKEYGLRFL
jgi:hypothetical protein